MNFFNIGTFELILIFIIALIVVGPRRLPEIARTLGKIMNDLRRMSQEFTAQMTQELNAPVKELSDLTKELKAPARELSEITKELGALAKEPLETTKEPEAPAQENDSTMPHDPPSMTTDHPTEDQRPSDQEPSDQ